MKSKEEHIIEHQKIFLAVTIIMMIVVILISDTLAQAVIIISLVSNLLVISSYMNLTHYRAKKYVEEVKGIGETTDTVEKFTDPDPEPTTTDGPAVNSTVGSTVGSTKTQYKGAISPVKVDDEYVPHYDDMMYYGHTRRQTGESLPWPNPYVQSDIEPTVGWTEDDEAVDVLDVNEKMVNRGRIDYKGRADVGTLSRMNIMNRFFREELDEQENRDWWGNFD